jgi:hypothetical protein
MKKETESKIQQDCFVWYSNTYARYGNGIMFSVPNENNGSQQRKVNTGLLRGVSDTIILHQGVCMFIEFKTLTGVISPFQKEFKEKVENQGFKYYLIRKLIDFQNLFTTFEK